MMLHTVSSQFHARAIERVNAEFDIDDDLCFVYVQHAFSPAIEYYTSVGDRMAAVILKGSSSTGNPAVVAELERRFHGRIFSDITRRQLADPDYAISLLKRVTRGRAFVILEYGAYFAPAAGAIARDALLGPNFRGVVEGTENGIRGSDDGSVPGYRHVIDDIACPVISKSRSSIKKIMDLDIGPAIVRASAGIWHTHTGAELSGFGGTIGVIGLGSIGQGVLTALLRLGLHPVLTDRCLPTLARMAHLSHKVMTQQVVLQQSDILYLNTGSCFLSVQPELLGHVKEDALLVLCTSGDVEAGIPQLVAAGHLRLLDASSTAGIACFMTRHGKRIRVMLGRDGVGQAPNMMLDDGSDSPANKMSDMEFYALGAYLGSDHCNLPSRRITDSPAFIQNMIVEEWLRVMHPSSVECPGGKTDIPVFPVERSIELS